MRIVFWATSALLISSAFSQNYTISTVAGTNRIIEGAPATTVPLRDPHAVAVDVTGAVYIADLNDNRVRKVSASGAITTVAGTGLPGYTGDRGPALKAQLNSPSSVAVDSAGNLYIADSGNFAVRRVTLDGVINTFAGTGAPGFAGDGGPASKAQVEPIALAFDNRGNLLISDATGRIRKVDAATNVITTIAGTGTLGFAGDSGAATLASIGLIVGIAVDPTGNIYLADEFNYRVRRIDTSGVITTVVGVGTYGRVDEGAPANQSILIPTGVAVDGTTLYVSDQNLDTIRRVDLTAGLIYTYAGNKIQGYSGDSSTLTSAEFNSPAGLALDNMKQLYVADEGNARVRKIAAGLVSTIAGTAIRDNGPATKAYLNMPEAVAVDPSGRLLIADYGNGELRQVNSAGVISSIGQLSGGFPLAVTTDAAGNIYVTDDEPAVLKITPSGSTTVLAGNGNDGYSGDGGPATAAAIRSPQGIAVDSNGNVFITDSTDNRIREINASGVITTIAGNGKATDSGDGGPAISAGIAPFDIAIDSSRNLYVSEPANNRVRKISANGTITTVAGTGVAGYTGDGGPATSATLKAPKGLAVDAAGYLFIADEGNGVVRRVTPDGLISTIAGTGTLVPASGDGGLATMAQLDPYRLTVDAAGNVYVSDSFNDLVRKLTPSTAKAAAVAIFAGNNQTGTTSMAAATNLAVTVTDSMGNPVPGVEVTFQVTSGGATVNPAMALTLQNGTASTQLTFGSTAGPVTVTATAAGLPAVTFSLTGAAPVSPTAPVINPGGIVSAGLSTPALTVVAPGTIATIFGLRLAPDGTARQATSADLVNGALPANLAGTCVSVGGQMAPIFAVYPGQINFQVPVLAPGSYPVQVTTNCGQTGAQTSATAMITIQAASPEFFYLQQAANGQNPIAAINSISGAVIGAPGSINGLTTVAASTNDYVTLFATGFGATSPAVAAGVLPTVAANVTGTVTVKIGGVTLDPKYILYTGLSQDAGLYQVNIQIPPGLPSGPQAVVITIGGVASPAGYLYLSGS